MVQTSRTILIVDDSPEDRELYRRYLSRDSACAYTVIEATLGQQGLDLWHQYQPDVVLLDYRLPDLDGVEFLAKLRSQVQGELPVIMVTGQGSEAIAVQSMKAGAQDYLVKEKITPEGLHRALNTVLETMQLRSQLHRTESALRDSEERFRQIAENINAVFWIMELPERRVSYVSSAYERLWGLQPKDLYEDRQIWVNRVHPEDRDGVNRAFQEKALKGGFDEEYRIVLPSGRTRWVRDRCFPLYDASGHAYRLTGIAEDITTRKQSETALRESQALFESFMRHIPATASIKDEAGRYLYVNPLNEQVCDRPITEWLGKTDFDLFSLEEAQQAQQNDQAALAANQAIERVETYQRTDRPHHFLTYRFPIQLSSEQRLVAGLSLDISDRKQAEQALQESEARLKLAHKATKSGLWDWDISHNVASISEEYCILFGLDSTTQHITYEQWLSLVHPDDRSAVTASIQRVIQHQQESYEVDYRILHAGGTRWMASRGQAFYDATGTAVRMLGNVQDISDRKQAELELERLLQREQQYASKLRGLTQAALSVNSAVTIHDVVQTITEQAYLIIGCHQAVTSMSIDQNWAQSITAIHLSDKYSQWRTYHEPPDGTGIYALVCQLNRPIRMSQAELEAHPRWQGFGQSVERHPPMRGWLAVPLVGRDGSNIGLVQLSDKYEGEFTEEDEAILVQLAQMAAIAIENTRLFEAEQAARAAAEQANRVKDEFLAVLSHELRSPLNPILGWSKLLQTHTLDPDRTAKALTTIERNAKLQTQLIDDLLDVAKILRGKLSMNVAPVNLAFVIESAIETVKTAAIAKNIALNLILPTIGKVSGDAARLQQIVWNLLSNAIKFTPNYGRVEIRLAVVPEPSPPTDRGGPPMNYAQMTISDTGKGIKPDFLPHIFESFWQEDASTTRQYGGLGLGLAIVRYLVEAHGGTISAHSEGEGRGSTFVVQLPLLDPALEANQSEGIFIPELNLAGLQILTVDDELDARELMTTVLAEYGANVLSVASALEALAHLESFRPDVVISDIGMPDVDGYMLIQQIRALPPEKGGQVPAIALTAYAREEDHQRAIASGYQKHVTKPLDLESLVRSVMDLAVHPTY